MATYSSIKYDFTPPSATTSAQVGAGAMTLIKTIDASADSTVNFVNGASSVVFDSTYKTYKISWVNIHPSADNESFLIKFREGSSAYDAPLQSTSFHSRHNQADDDARIFYDTFFDNANTTTGQKIADTGVDNEQGFSGVIWIFNPSSTTFVKHYIGNCGADRHNDTHNYASFGGYCNVTAAIDAIQFGFASGNIDSGVIKLYGIS